MGPINTGPDGCWKAAALMAIAGVVATVYVIVKAVIWVLNHVHIK